LIRATKTILRLSLIAFATNSLWFSAAIGACSCSHYEIELIPLLPTSINAREQIAGTTPEHRAAVWSKKSGVSVIPLPTDASTSTPNSINRSGHVVGTAYDPSYKVLQGFEYYRGRMKVFSGQQVRLTAINDANEIVGESVPAGKSSSEPTLWRNGKRFLLTTCCGGSALSINAHGDVVGDSYDSHGNYTASLWNNHGDLTRLGPPDRASIAIAINQHGSVAIQASSRIMRYDSGRLEEVSVPTRYPTHPRGINDCGTIVGSYGPFSDADRAFIWDKTTGFRDLNSLIEPDSGWKLETAAAINDNGEIVGKGDFGDDEDVGFLLIPRS